MGIPESTTAAVGEDHGGPRTPAVPSYLAPLQASIGDEDAALAEHRRQGVGGSDVAAIVGLNPYRTAIDVWMDKVGLGSEDPGEAAYWGKLLEPIIAGEYMRRTGVEVMRPDPPVWIDPEVAWIRGTPDYLVARAGGIDCKLTNPRQAHRWGEPGTDQVPEEHLAQAQWYLRLARRLGVDAEWWDIPVLIGHEFRIYRITPNPALQDTLAELCGEFWHRYVVPRTPPPVDHTESARRMLERLHPRDLGTLRPATDAEEQLAEQYLALERRIDALLSERDRVGNLLRAAVGDDAGIAGRGWRLSWRRTRDGATTDWEAVARSLWNDFALVVHSSPELSRLLGNGRWQELVAQHTTPRPGSRRFLLKPMKDNGGGHR
ncbi:MAG: YqaJ viral recombinase family protein [Armatimonadota bacterium]|nr:YqaJ viral recombinase family protein [Armatimonadota bacterium]